MLNICTSYGITHQTYVLWENVLDAVNEINLNKKDVIKNMYCNYNKRLLKILDYKGKVIND